MNDLQQQGWVRLHRKICNNQLWFLEPFTKAQAWVDLFLNANHKDGIISIRGNIITIKRGQIGWSELTMCKRWIWSKDKVRRFLKLLETIQQIKQDKSTLTTIITILNYEEYQSDIQQIIQQTEQQKDSRRYTNKNDKNEKNIYIPLEEQLKPFKDQYSQSMIEKFTNHFIETNAKGKQRWQLEKTWDINLRLKRWKRQQDDWDYEKSQRNQRIVEDKPKERRTGIDSGFTPITFNN
jgi:hypothetical protein